MNNSLRERFALDAKNSAMVSRIIKDATAAKLVRLVDETVGNKARKYIPWWA
jgi:ATP-dependent DNA helicase RecG